MPAESKHHHNTGPCSCWRVIKAPLEKRRAANQKSVGVMDDLAVTRLAIARMYMAAINQTPLLLLDLDIIGKTTLGLELVYVDFGEGELILRRSRRLANI